MPHSAYPDEGDLSSYLAGMEIDFGETDLSSALAGGIADFEGRAGYRFLVSTDTTRRLDPALSREGTLYFNYPLASLSSVSYYPYSSGGEQTLSLHTDFLLGPEDAPLRSEPYFYLISARSWHLPLSFGVLQALRVTGKWGWGTAIPDDVWGAMLQSAAGFAVASLPLQSDFNLIEWKEGAASYKYDTTGRTGGGGGKDGGSVSAADRIVRRYRAKVLTL